MELKKETTAKKKDGSALANKTYNQQASKNRSESALQGRPGKSNADTKDYGQKDKKNLKDSCCD